VTDQPAAPPENDSAASDSEVIAGNRRPAYDDLSDEARFYLENWDELDLAEMAAASKARFDALKADLDTAQRRAVRLVERIGDARVWARSNLDAEQQGELLAILGTGPAAARQGPK
jgi:hypothetical protein